MPAVGFKAQYVPHCPVPNLVCETGSPHWYISYNHETRTYGCETTALVLGQGEYFLVLRGDHRTAFAAILAEVSASRTRLARCLDYVRENREQLHDYSDTLA